MKIINTIFSKNKPPIWMDVLVLLILIAISYFKPIPFPWKVPTIAVIIIIYTYINYNDLSYIGLGKFKWKNTLIWGITIALIIVVIIGNLFMPIMERLLNKEVDVSGYGALKGNTGLVMNLWWKAMISAAVAEEIFYRGFTFYVFERIFKGFKYDKELIVLLSAIYFGISHNFQGITGIIGIIVVAIVFGSGYYLSKKNLYSLILAHALVDSWGLFSLYKGGINFFF